MRYAWVVVLVLAIGCDKSGDDKAGPGVAAGSAAATGSAPAAGSGGGVAGIGAEANMAGIATGSAAGAGAPSGALLATGSAEGSGSAAAALAPLKVGDQVTAQWTTGTWYSAKVAAVNADGTFNINFDDGDKLKNVPASKVRAIPPPKSDWKVGDKVQGKWTDGYCYKGTFAAVNADGTFKVKYDDGDVSNALPAAKVRAIPPKSASTGKTGGTASDAPCPGPGLTRRCNGVCVNIQEDNNHCGGCNNRCPSGKTCDGHMFCRDAAGNL